MFFFLRKNNCQNGEINWLSVFIQYILYIVITATGAGLLPHDNYSLFERFLEMQFGHSGQELHMTAPLSLLNISWNIEFQGSPLNKNQILGHEEFTQIKFLVP